MDVPIVSKEGPLDMSITDKREAPMLVEVKEEPLDPSEELVDVPVFVEIIEEPAYTPIMTRSLDLVKDAFHVEEDFTNGSNKDSALQARFKSSKRHQLSGNCLEKRRVSKHARGKAKEKTLKCHSSSQNLRTNNVVPEADDRTSAPKQTNILECNVCGNVLATRSGLKRHLIRHTEGKSSKRKRSPPAGEGAAALEAGATGERPSAADQSHVCEECGNKFANRSTLLRHAKTHTGERPHACEECGERFTRLSILVEHERTHTGERPYGCGTCHKTFTQRPHLVRHARTHTGERPYRCATCDEAFANRSKLVMHQGTHTGKWPYSCDVCGNKFAKCSDLVRHARSHSGERPYSCELCNQKFTQHYNLLTHMRIHTGEKSHNAKSANKNSDSLDTH